MNFVVAGIMISNLDGALGEVRVGAAAAPPADLDELSAEELAEHDRKKQEDECQLVKCLQEVEADMFWTMCGIMETVKMRELWRKGLPR